MTVFLDRWNKTPRIDWNQVITNEIRESDFVLAVSSPSYKLAAEGNAPNGANLGVQHELAIIRELLNSDRSTWLPKIIPVILPDWAIHDVPTVLQPTTANHCAVEEINERGLSGLIELLTSGHNGRVGSWGMRLNSLTDSIRRSPINTHSRRTTVAVSGAVVAAITVSVIVIQSFGIENSTVISGSGNNMNENSAPCAQVVNSSCEISLQEDLKEAQESPAENDDEFKAELAREAREEPTDFGSGPWPFAVVDTLVDGADFGLFARTTNTVAGDRLGSAGNRSIVWADCVARSDYTPKVETIEDVGPLWLHVRWTPVAPTERSTSEPSGTERAWMYRGGLVPIKHDGDIPSCD